MIHSTTLNQSIFTSISKMLSLNTVVQVISKINVKIKLFLHITMVWLIQIISNYNKNNFLPSC